MYPTSFKVFRALLPCVAFAVIGEIALAIVQEKVPIGSGDIFVSVLIWSYLAFNAHAVILVPKNREKTANNLRVVGFTLRSCGIGALFLLPAFIMIATLDWELFHPATWSEVPASWAAIGLILAVCFAVVFSLLGSLLPAFVADRARGLGPALSRGWRQFFPTAARLLAGPVVMFVIADVAFLAGGIHMAPHTDLLNAIYIPNVPMFAILIFGYLIQALGTIMVAVVLSNAFLSAESGEVNMSKAVV